MKHLLDTLRGQTWAIALAVVALAAYGWHAHAYQLFLSDDALISLRYSERLLEGHGLTWTDGERVEGYSNLLWVLAAAGLGFLGLDLVDAVRVLGFLGLGSVVVAIVWAYRPTTWRAAARLLPAALVPGVSGAFAAWTYGGLEQPMIVGLLVWALVLSFPLLETPRPTARQILLPGLILALLCLTRPDSPLFAASIGLGLLLLRGLNGPTIRTVFTLALLPAVAVVGQLAFRLAYYGEWVPNTALVKIAFSAHRVAQGVHYVREGMIYYAPLLAFVVVCLVLAVFNRLPRRRLLFLAVPVVLWCLYLVGVGGDIFQARRHMLPAIAILALMAADVLAAGLPTLSQRARRVGMAGAMAMIVLQVGFQRRDPENYNALNTLWTWEGMSIGTALGQGFGSARPLIAVSAAGCLPYWSKLPSLDVLGLNDHYLPRHPPKGFGRGYIGHEMGDGRYVLGRQPDLVFFGGPRSNVKPIFFADQDLYAQPGFRAGYVPCRFEGNPPYKTPSNIWVRRDGRVGIRREHGAIAVPGYLFNGHTETQARLDATGRFAITSSAAAPAVLPRLDVPAGRWKLAFDPPTAWRATVRQGPQTRTLDGDAHVDLAGGAPVSITLVPAGDRPANLREVRLVPAR
jgi:hypothetical protein